MFSGTADFGKYGCGRWISIIFHHLPSSYATEMISSTQVFPMTWPPEAPASPLPTRLLVRDPRWEMRNKFGKSEVELRWDRFLAFFASYFVWEQTSLARFTEALVQWYSLKLGAASSKVLAVILNHSTNLFFLIHLVSSSIILFLFVDRMMSGHNGFKR